MILFPSTNSWWALAGVVLVDTLGSVVQLRVLYKCTVKDMQEGKGVSEETKRALWTQCEIDVARFWPVVVALPPLVWLMDERNPNRQYYYLFECTTSDHMNITVVCILVKTRLDLCSDGSGPLHVHSMGDWSRQSPADAQDVQQALGNDGCHFCLCRCHFHKLLACEARRAATS